MKKIFLAILGLVIICVLIGLAFHFLNKPDAVAHPSEATDPFAGLVSGPAGQAPGGKVTPSTLTLALRDGTELSIPDFTKQNQPEWAGPSGYLVVGSPTDDYMATFIPSDQQRSPATFTLILQNEPLGEVRVQAETALREKLNLTNDQLCAIGVAVYTQPGLSDIYDARNLGLSFCPGSVKLP